MGQSPPSKFYNRNGEGLFFIQGNKEFQDLYVMPEIYTSKCNKTAPENSVLITVRAPVGNVNLTLQEICIGRGVAAIFHKDNDFLKNRFCYYILRGLEDYIMSFGEGGTTYESITKKDLENIQIPLPPPDEQSRIAAVLSWFDDLIENKKQQNEILEKTAMALFKSWFVDFEPFRDVEFVYSEELGREVPWGWEAVTLKDLTKDIFSGRGKYAIDEKEGKYPLWGANGVIGQAEKYDVDGFAILTGRVGTLGKVFLVEGKFAVSDNVLAAIPKEEWVTFYLYILMKTQIDYESLNVGSTQPLITKTDLGNQLSLLPPDSILQRFHEMVEPLFRKIINNEKEIMVLKRARDALLPLLVFGKLRVEAIE